MWYDSIRDTSLLKGLYIFQLFKVCLNFIYFGGSGFKRTITQMARVVYGQERRPS